MPNARIMTYRHNSQWKSNALDKELYDHGVQLLKAIERSRNSEEVRSNPIHCAICQGVCANNLGLLTEQGTSAFAGRLRLWRPNHQAGKGRL